MAKVFTNDENYENIAEAIRYMNGENTTYTPEEMAGAIRSIPAGATIPDGSVTTEKLANEAVTFEKIASQAVGTPNLKDRSVTSGKLGAFAVTASKIDGGAVGEAQLATGAVTTAKIKDKAVTPEKLNLVLRNLLTQLTNMLEWYNQTDIITLSDLGTIQSTAPLNLELNHKTICNFVAAAGAAQRFGVESGTSCQMVFIGDYQVVTFAVYNKKYYRHIDSYAPSFIAGEWTLAT